MPLHKGSPGADQADGDRRLAMNPFFAEADPTAAMTAAPPVHRLPDGPMPPKNAYQIVRDELMLEVVRHVVEQEERSILPAMAPTSAPADMRDALRSGLEHYFAGVVSDPDHERAMYELSQYSQRTPGAEHLARLQYESYFALAVSSLRAAAELVHARWTLPVEDVGRMHHAVP